MTSPESTDGSFEERPGWRKLTHTEARTEQRLDALKMSVAERLKGLAELNRRMYRMQGVKIDDGEAAVVGRFISRCRR